MRVLVVGLGVGTMVLGFLTGCGGDDFESADEAGTAGATGPENCVTDQICSFQSDCPTDQRCNGGASRCVDAVVDELARDCSLTPCIIDLDCPDGYACSLSTSRCFVK